MGAFFGLYLLLGVIQEVDVRRVSWFHSDLVYWPTLFGVPIGIVALTAWIRPARGMRIWYAWLQAIAFPAVFVLQLLALWATYTRGAMIALAVAAVAMSVWMLLRGSAGKRLIPGIVGASLACVMACGALLVAGGAGAQEDASQAAQPASPVEMPAEGDSVAEYTPPPMPEGAPVLSAEGRAPTTGELTNLATFRLRLTYWSVGLRMARERLFSGVGWGNFETSYPKFQYIGAGDVKEAHNDYVQALAETGIPGLLLFCAFWGVLMVQGGVRIWREQDPRQRLLLAGLLTGLLAFCIHAFVDFNFQNPSLTNIVFILAGTFLSKCHFLDAARRGEAEAPADSPEKAHLPSQLTAIPLLLVVALFAGTSLRLYFFDTYAEQFKPLGVSASGNRPLAAAREMLAMEEDTRQYYLPVVKAGALIPLREDLARAGVFGRMISANPVQFERIPDGQRLTTESYIVFTDVPAARAMAKHESLQYIERLLACDSMYGELPEMAATIYSWYAVLATFERNPRQREEFARRALYWAEEGVSRSPWQPWFHNWLGEALWLRASVAQGEDAVRFALAAVESYEEACRSYPSNADLWDELALQAERVRQKAEEANMTELAARYHEKAEDAREEAQRIWQAKSGVFPAHADART